MNLMSRTLWERIPGGEKLLPLLLTQRQGLRSLRALLEAPLSVSWKTKFSTLYVFPVVQRRMILLTALAMGGVVYVGLPMALWWAFTHTPPWLFAFAVILANHAFGELRSWRRSITHRRGFDRLMVEGGVITVAKGDKVPRTGAKVGKPKKDEFGMSQKFRISGSTWEVVAKRSDVLAGVCGVPSSLFAVEHDPKDPPNVFTIWIGNRQRGRGTAMAAIPECCDFHEPFRIGQTLAGRATVASMFEFNTLVGGIPGMGKTSVVRQFMLRNLLDPEGRTFLVDGKGSKKDYKGAIEAYSGYVDGNDDDALDQVEAMLEHIHEMINKANGEDERIKVLLVLDEWQDIRAGADKDQLKRVDNLIIRIHKKGRATGLHLLLATQRASAVSIPTEMRSLFRQAIAFRQKNGTDYGMVLGHAPSVAEPGEPGEAIISGDRGQEFVMVDHLSQEQWVEVIPRLTARESVSLKREPVADPVAQEVVRAAQTLTEDRVPVTILWEALDTERLAAFGVPNPIALGKFLGNRGVTVRNSAGRYYLRAELLGL